MHQCCCCCHDNWQNRLWLFAYDLYVFSSVMGPNALQPMEFTSLSPGSFVHTIIRSCCLNSLALFLNVSTFHLRLNPSPSMVSPLYPCVEPKEFCSLSNPPANQAASHLCCRIFKTFSSRLDWKCDMWTVTCLYFMQSLNGEGLSLPFGAGQQTWILLVLWMDNGLSVFI